MYIVKNFLSDMAYSTSGGDRAEKIMMFQEKKIFVQKSDFSEMAIIRVEKACYVRQNLNHFRLSKFFEISTRCSQRPYAKTFFSFC